MTDLIKVMGMTGVSLLQANRSNKQPSCLFVCLLQEEVTVSYFETDSERQLPRSREKQSQKRSAADSMTQSEPDDNHAGNCSS